MKGSLRTIAFGALAMMCWSALAAEPARGVTAAEVARILQDAGYSAKIGKAGDGTPRIDSNMGGVDVVIDFYDCEADRCGSLQLTTGIDLEKGSTYQVINTFNSEYRYGSAYLDDAMDPFIEYDFEVVNTDHGAYIRSQIELWEEVLGYFIKAIESGSSKPATK